MSPRVSSRALAVAGAVLLWVVSAVVSFATLAFTDDHFHRTAQARQIAFHGAFPFRDFFDPGYLLTEYISAGLLRGLGDTLLGEALVPVAAAATGTVLLFLASRRISGSIAVRVVCALLPLLLLPRTYDYDKVLCYPLGVLLCWRYADAPGVARAAAIGAGLVLAMLFRYDSGVYLGGAAVATMAIVHAGAWGTAARRLGVMAAVALLLSLPVLAALQVRAGLPDVVDQVLAYGRREAARTRLSAPPAFRLPAARSGEDGTGARANGDAFLYRLLRLLPLAGAALLAGQVVRMRGQRGGGAAWSRTEAARIGGLVVMCVLLNVFILRDPVGARIGGMAGPPALLAAWLALVTWRAPGGAVRLAGRTLVVVLVAGTVWSMAHAAEWRDRLAPDAFRPARLADSLARLAAAPPRLDGQPVMRVAGLVHYLRECTGPQDRVLVTWFAPDIYVFAQRGFAARMPVVFGGHWSEPRFARRSVEALAAERALVVIVRDGDDRFAADHPALAAFVAEHYREAGTTTFGGGAGAQAYTVLVRRDRSPSRLHAPTSLPCF